MSYILRSPAFWIPFLATLLVAGLFFTWELGLLIRLVPTLPRANPTDGDIIFSLALGLLLALDVGLGVWTMRRGSCPRGIKRATGIAGVLGAITLLCPFCLALPVSFIGLSLAFALVSPFLPLLRLISLILLTVAVTLLWPKKK